jgi:hypothetical protein
MNDENSTSHLHEDAHGLVEVRFVGVDQWTVAVAANENGTHQEFRLLWGEGEWEILGCYVGNPEPEAWGVPRDDVLAMAAHVGWHVATGTPPQDVHRHRDAKPRTSSTQQALSPLRQLTLLGSVVTPSA